MRRIIITLTILSTLALATNVSAFGLTQSRSIRHQMLANGLAMERIESREMEFTDQIEEESLGGIYEYKLKSPFKAFMLSLAVPGLGEYYVGNKIKAGSFLAADLILWTGYFVYRGKGSDKEDEFKAYADNHYIWTTYIQWWDMQDSTVQAAYSHRLPWDDNANQPIFNHEYYENIGKYHQFQVGWDDIGINIPPSPEGGYVSPHRSFYLNLRKQSNDYFSNATTIAMVSIANHIISAFDAAISAKKYNRGAKQYSLQLKTIRYNGEMTPFVEFTAKFQL